jgi:hypothetical protein
MTMMATGRAKVARVKNGLPHFAEVALEIDRRPGNAEVSFRCGGTGFIGQGLLEEVPPSGYDDWKAGARAGVELALAVAEVSGAHVRIDHIAGLTTDTNPTLVGVAAALAVWRALGFSPSEEVVNRLEAIAFASWQRAPEEIPRFG